METVRALFFARYRDLVGTSEVEVKIPELPEGEAFTVRDLVHQVRERGEPFSRLPPDATVAVNRHVAGARQPVRAGDEVAFLPPVAGG